MTGLLHKLLLRHVQELLGRTARFSLRISRGHEKGAGRRLYILTLNETKAALLVRVALVHSLMALRAERVQVRARVVRHGRVALSHDRRSLGLRLGDEKRLRRSRMLRRNHATEVWPAKLSLQAFELVQTIHRQVLIVREMLLLLDRATHGSHAVARLGQHTLRRK